MKDKKIGEKLKL